MQKKMLILALAAVVLAIAFNPEFIANFGSDIPLKNTNARKQKSHSNGLFSVSSFSQHASSVCLVVIAFW